MVHIHLKINMDIDFQHKIKKDTNNYRNLLSTRNMRIKKVIFLWMSIQRVSCITQVFIPKYNTIFN